MTTTRLDPTRIKYFVDSIFDKNINQQNNAKVKYYDESTATAVAVFVVQLAGELARVICLCVSNEMMEK